MMGSMMWKRETWKVKGVCEREVRVGLEERREDAGEGAGWLLRWLWLDKIDSAGRVRFRVPPLPHPCVSVSTWQLDPRHLASVTLHFLIEAELGGCAPVPLLPWIDVEPFEGAKP
jgi:hypothetical protein